MSFDIQKNQKKHIQFNILLAGYTIGICCLYPEVKELCKDYITSSTPDFAVITSMEDIEYERGKSNREAVNEGRNSDAYSNEYLETLAIYRKIATELLKYDILLMHGSVIAVDGVAYLFTAKSGTGKSTHTKLWRELFGERAIMVNDDKPLLKITDDGVIAYGTPWNGKHHIGSNVSSPLHAICVLERCESNHIEIVERKDMVSFLFQQCYRPSKTDELMKTLSLIDILRKNVHFYRLGCNMEMEAAQIAYDAMKP